MRTIDDRASVHARRAALAHSNNRVSRRYLKVCIKNETHVGCFIQIKDVSRIDERMIPHVAVQFKVLNALHDTNSRAASASQPQL